MSTLPFCYSFLLPHPTGKNRARPSAALTERGKKALWRRAPPPPARGRSRRVCRRIRESTTGRPLCHPRPASFARGRRRRPPGPARATGVGPARQQAAPPAPIPAFAAAIVAFPAARRRSPARPTFPATRRGSPARMAPPAARVVRFSIHYVKSSAHQIEARRFTFLYDSQFT